MKILVLSHDDTIINSLAKKNIPAELIFLKEGVQVWSIMEALTSKTISIAIVDDDLLQPDSEKIIKMTQRLKENIGIIFLTSDRGLDLGKKISQLGIDYYGIKPISEKDLCQALSSILETKARQFN